MVKRKSKICNNIYCDRLKQAKGKYCKACNKAYRMGYSMGNLNKRKKYK